eukprot:c5869_g1_i1.p1 GENE.c5869_g1_i1~~c5869_g1_i1.p1  ORF type:complete len:109 (+),score=39.88 c5869_g1_i1:25-327(+)
MKSFLKRLLLLIFAFSICIVTSIDRKAPVPELPVLPESDIFEEQQQESVVPEPLSQEQIDIMLEKVFSNVGSLEKNNLFEDSNRAQILAEMFEKLKLKEL